ncbi:helix-turn-helix domain-containing protein [Lawsonibacter sp.]|uniref:helix-turn-helix domain-containing protein n=1 Tax=Lawsonibacter sp. TaxID=2185275 RepID=UPI00258D5F4C|nr:helix-turn-helix transcriptional regulator [Lawsonibacter sp.]MCI6399815.1 helix-turn-helix domain-containing protein [Lawsonibacter sp.]
MKAEHQERYRELGLKIAYYRKLRGLTQEQLAEQVDRTPAFIGHVEAPNIPKAISLDTLFDISNALSVPVYKFFLFESDNP